MIKVLYWIVRRHKYWQAREELEIRVGNDLVSSSQTISLLGLQYDKNFSTAPYLRQLARDANTRATLIKRFSFGMQNCLLKPIANGLLMGKVLAAAPEAISVTPSEIPKSRQKNCHFMKYRFSYLLWYN